MMVEKKKERRWAPWGFYKLLGSVGILGMKAFLVIPVPKRICCRATTSQLLLFSEASRCISYAGVADETQNVAVCVPQA